MSSHTVILLSLVLTKRMNSSTETNFFFEGEDCDRRKSKYPCCYPTTWDSADRVVDSCLYIARPRHSRSFSAHLVPTTPFILLSAFAALRGSERLHRKLKSHKQFGPMITNWDEEGSISRRVKLVAIGTQVVCLIIICFVQPHWWIAPLMLTMMVIVSIWLWTRPEPASSSKAQV